MEPQGGTFLESTVWVGNGSSVGNIKDDIQAIERTVTRLSNGFTGAPPDTVEVIKVTAAYRLAGLTSQIGDPLRSNSLLSPPVARGSSQSQSEVDSVASTSELPHHLRGWSEGIEGDFDCVSGDDGALPMVVRASQLVDSKDHTLRRKTPLAQEWQEGLRGKVNSAKRHQVQEKGVPVGLQNEVPSSPVKNSGPMEQNISVEGMGNNTWRWEKKLQDTWKGGSDHMEVGVDGDQRHHEGRHQWKDWKKKRQHLQQQPSGDPFDDVDEGAEGDTEDDAKPTEWDKQGAGWSDVNTGWSLMVDINEQQIVAESLQAECLARDTKLVQLRSDTASVAAYDSGSKGLTTTLNEKNGDTPMPTTTPGAPNDLENEEIHPSVVEATHLRQELLEARQELDSLQQHPSAGELRGQQSGPQTKASPAEVAAVNAPVWPSTWNLSSASSDTRMGTMMKTRTELGVGTDARTALGLDSATSPVVMTAQESLRNMRGMLEDRECEASRAAERVAKLRVELKQSETERTSMATKLEEMEKALGEAREEAGRLSRAAEASQALVEGLDVSLVERERELNDAEDRLEMAAGELRGERAEVTLLRAQLETVRSEMERAERRAEGAEVVSATSDSSGRGEGDSENLANLVKALEVKQSEVEVARGDAKRAMADAEASREEVEVLKADVEELQVENERAHSKLVVEREHAQLRSEKMQQMQEGLETTVREMQEKIMMASCEAEGAWAEMDAMRKEINQVTADTEQRQKRLETSLRAKVAELKATRSEADVAQSELVETRKEVQRMMQEVKEAQKQLRAEKEGSALLSMKLQSAEMKYSQAVDRLTRTETEGKSLQKNLADAMSNAEGNQERLQAQSALTAEKLGRARVELERLGEALAAALTRAQEEHELRGQESKRARSLTRDVEVSQARLKLAEGERQRSELQVQELKEHVRADVETLTRLESAIEERDAQLEAAEASLGAANRRALDAEEAVQSSKHESEIALREITEAARRTSEDQARLKHQLLEAREEAAQSNTLLGQVRLELEEANLVLTTPGRKGVLSRDQRGSRRHRRGKFDKGSIRGEVRWKDTRDQGLTSAGVVTEADLMDLREAYYEIQRISNMLEGEAAQAATVTKHLLSSRWDDRARLTTEEEVKTLSSKPLPGWQLCQKGGVSGVLGRENMSTRSSEENENSADSTVVRVGDKQGPHSAVSQTSNQGVPGAVVQKVVIARDEDVKSTGWGFAVLKTAVPSVAKRLQESVSFLMASQQEERGTWVGKMEHLEQELLLARRREAETMARLEESRELSREQTGFVEGVWQERQRMGKEMCVQKEEIRRLRASEEASQLVAKELESCTAAVLSQVQGKLGGSLEVKGEGEEGAKKGVVSGNSERQVCETVNILQRQVDGLRLQLNKTREACSGGIDEGVAVQNGAVVGSGNNGNDVIERSRRSTEGGGDRNGTRARSMSSVADDTGSGGEGFAEHREAVGEGVQGKGKVGKRSRVKGGGPQALVALEGEFQRLRGKYEKAKGRIAALEDQVAAARRGDALARREVQRALKALKMSQGLVIRLSKARHRHRQGTVPDGADIQPSSKTIAHSTSASEGGRRGETATQTPYPPVSQIPTPSGKSIDLAVNIPSAGSTAHALNGTKAWEAGSKRISLHDVNHCTNGPVQAIPEEAHDRLEASIMSSPLGRLGGSKGDAKMAAGYRGEGETSGHGEGEDVTRGSGTAPSGSSLPMVSSREVATQVGEVDLWCKGEVITTQEELEKMGREAIELKSKNEVVEQELGKVTTDLAEAWELLRAKDLKILKLEETLNQAKADLQGAQLAATMARDLLKETEQSSVEAREGMKAADARLEEVGKGLKQALEDVAKLTRLLQASETDRMRVEGELSTARAEAHQVDKDVAHVLEALSCAERERERLEGELEEVRREGRASLKDADRQAVEREAAARACALAEGVQEVATLKEKVVELEAKLQAGQDELKDTVEAFSANIRQLVRDKASNALQVEELGESLARAGEEAAKVAVAASTSNADWEERLRQEQADQHRRKKASESAAAIIERDLRKEVARLERVLSAEATQAHEMTEQRDILQEKVAELEDALKVKKERLQEAKYQVSALRAMAERERVSRSAAEVGIEKNLREEMVHSEQAKKEAIQLQKNAELEVAALRATLSVQEKKRIAVEIEASRLAEELKEASLKELVHKAARQKEKDMEAALKKAQATLKEVSTAAEEWKKRCEQAESILAAGNSTEFTHEIKMESGACAPLQSPDVTCLERNSSSREVGSTSFGSTAAMSAGVKLGHSVESGNLLMMSMGGKDYGIPQNPKKNVPWCMTALADKGATGLDATLVEKGTEGCPQPDLRTEEGVDVGVMDILSTTRPSEVGMSSTVPVCTLRTSSPAAQRIEGNPSFGDSNDMISSCRNRHFPEVNLKFGHSLRPESTLSPSTSSLEGQSKLLSGKAPWREAGGRLVVRGWKAGHRAAFNELDKKTSAESNSLQNEPDPPVKQC